MLSAEEVEGYSKDGQITSVVSLPPAMVRELRGKMQSFFEAQPGVDQDYAANLIDQDNSWLKYAMLPEILDTVRALIGDDIIVWGSALFAKKGIGGKATPWHQDGHYWPIRPLQTVTAWIAIDDVDTGNGCLRVIPTSHADQKLHDHYTEDSPDVVLNQALEVGDDRFGTPRDVELKAGQFSVHDVYLIHGAAANDSGRRRAGLVFRYMPSTSHFDRELARQQTKDMNVPDLSERQLHLVSGVDRSGNNDIFNAGAVLSQTFE